MRTMMRILFALAATLLLSAPAWAGTRDPVVKQREHRQAARIRQGERSGELTHHEAHKLRQEQHAIHREEKAFKSDGTLTPAERRKLHHDQDAASRHIRHEKHDVDKRPRAR